jgi:hypothetical protein
MREERKVPGPAMRIVLELSRENETVSGTLTTAEESRGFWGWLELISALERAAGANPGEFVPAEDRQAWMTADQSENGGARSNEG